MPAKETKAKEDSDFRYIVRLVNTDLDGNKLVSQALTSIKGVGHRTARMILEESEIPDGRIGDLSDEQIKELGEVLEEIEEFIPTWLLNRRKDYYSGDDIHILGIELTSQKADDINRFRMIRCYKGTRHETGRKVRGQKTKSNGRKGTTMGVQKKKLG